MNINLGFDTQRLGPMYLFTHYDSRGGAFLTKATNAIEAVEKYLKNIFTVEKDDEEMWNMMADNTLTEDFEGKYEVIIAGAEWPEEEPRELLATYSEDGEGFFAFRVGTEFGEAPILVLLTREVLLEQFNVEEPEELGEERFDLKDGYYLEHWDIGEDACGLCTF